MEMDKVNEKLKTFERMVMKDAAHKAGQLVNRAEEDKQRLAEEKEIEFLKDAYQKIQEALKKIEKESNEAYSAKLLEVKHLLFSKRTEIIDAVLKGVEEKLESFRNSSGYLNKLKELIIRGMEEVGQGEIHVITDKEDIPYAEKTVKEFKGIISIEESEEPLNGGCIVVNETNGVLADYSFRTRLEQQREAFLQNSGMNVDI